MKRRIEKKYDNQFRTGWCVGCGEDHGGERRVERARRLRVERTMRRVRRNESRRVKKSDVILKDVVFALKFDAKKFIASINQAAENISRKFKEFFDDVSDRSLGTLEKKTFTGIRQDAMLREDHEDSKPYVARLLQHAMRPNSDETLCGMPWVRPLSDIRLDSVICPGCFTVDLVPHAN